MTLEQLAYTGAAVASALLRSALVAIALLASAWLVLGFRAVELEADADVVIGRVQRGNATAGDVRHGRDLLRRARLLSVDTAPLLDEGLMLFSYGRREEGLAITQEVVADEPENVVGWIALHTLFSGKGDAKRAAETARRVRALNPLAGDALER